MRYWIVDTSTGDVLSGGLQENQVSQFIDFNTIHHLLENLMIHSDNGEEWSSITWQKVKG